MKIMLLSDLHLRSSTPASRMDNFFETQLKKFKSVLRLYTELDCKVLLQAGDFFDKPNPGNKVLTAYIKAMSMFAPHKAKPLCVYGQHDQYMRNSGEGRTGLEVLEAAGVLEILHDEPVIRGHLSHEQCAIYGMHFGQTEIPSTKKTKKYINILVTHRSIGHEALYPGHDLLHPKKFSRMCKGYNLILCADYHYRFQWRSKKKLVVNSGCMVRLTIDDIRRKHKPGLYIYDTKTRTVDWYKIKHQPTKKVFRETISKTVSKTNFSLAELINKVASQQDNVGTDYTQNLLACVKERKAGKKIRNFLLNELATCRQEM